MPSDHAKTLSDTESDRVLTRAIPDRIGKYVIINEVGRGSTGTVYWEGLSELLDAGGRRVGLGYLEMTGYAGALRL